MKSVIFLIVFMSAFPLRASSLSVAIPISVKHQYENDISLELVRDDSGNLKKLTLSVGDKVHLVPNNLLQEVINPEISTTRVYINKAANNVSTFIEVSIDYNYRYYQWGLDKSFVTFYFSKEKFLRRNHTIPIGKGKYEVVDSLS